MFQSAVYTSAVKKNALNLQHRGQKGFYLKELRPSLDQSAAISTSQSEREKFILMSCGANAVSIGKVSSRWIKVDLLSSTVKESS